MFNLVFHRGREAYETFKGKILKIKKGELDEIDEDLIKIIENIYGDDILFKRSRFNPEVIIISTSDDIIEIKEVDLYEKGDV